MLTEEPTIIDLKPDPAPPRLPSVVPSSSPDVVPHFDLPPAKPKLPPLGAKRWAVRLSLLVLMLCLTAVVGHWGHVLRDSLYDGFPLLRHYGDIANAFNQGTRVNEIATEIAINAGRTEPTLHDVYRGWVKRFDDAYERGKEADDYDFDYVPLRLLMPTLWVRHLRHTMSPTPTNWQDGFAFTSPMLHLNTAFGALTALAMFLLVRHWVLRAGRTPGPTMLARASAALSRLRPRAGSSAPASPLSALQDPPSRPPTIKAWALGWVAAVLVWFEPNILVESHIWPQWDLWIVPFFLLAVWMASANWWLCAGMMLGIGAMFKGQMLFAAPVFILWPIFEMQPGRLVRLLVGFGAAFFGIASPWLLQTDDARVVVGLTAVACGLMVPYFWLRRASWPFGVVSVLAAGAVLWPFLRTRDWDTIVMGLPLVALLLAGPWLLPRRAAGVWIMAVVVGAVLLGAIGWGGTWSWWFLGIGFGTHHRGVMYAGPSVNNLAALLRDVYRWDLYDVVTTITLPQWLVTPLARFPDYVQDGELIVTVKLLSSSIYVAASALCAAAMARHARRNDPRFLLAAIAPWVVFFAVMPQMHERYLFWGAVIAAAGVGVSLGMTLMWAIVSFVSVGMILHCQLSGDGPQAYAGYPEAWQAGLRNIRFVLTGTHPGIGWMVMLVACVYLYLALTSSPRRLWADRRAKALSVMPND